MELKNAEKGCGGGSEGALPSDTPVLTLFKVSTPRGIHVTFKCHNSSPNKSPKCLCG